MHWGHTQTRAFFCPVAHTTDEWFIFNKLINPETFSLEELLQVKTSQACCSALILDKQPSIKATDLPAKLDSVWSIFTATVTIRTGSCFTGAFLWDSSSQKTVWKLYDTSMTHFALTHFIQLTWKTSIWLLLWSRWAHNNMCLYFIADANIPFKPFSLDHLKLTSV